jgi:flagellar hook-length control protein FliK
MRVDLLSNNIASASDAPVKTAEDAENGSAGNFFAEIGRALNADEPEGNPTGKKGSELNSDEQDGNDLSLFMSACLFALQPLNPDLVLDPTITNSKGESAETSNTAISNEQMSAGAVKVDSDEKGKRTDLKSNLDLFDRTTYSLLSVQNPGIQNAETDAVDRNAALNGIALKTKSTVPDKLIAAENIAQGDISPDLQTIDASSGSMPFEFSKTGETQVIEASEKTSVQLKLSGTETLLENVSKDTAAFQPEFNKLEPEGENLPAAQSQQRFPETASHERFIPVDKTNPTRKENSIHDVLKGLDPSAINVAQEIDEIPQADIVNPVSKALESMAFQGKSEGTPESLKTNNSAVENSQEKFASMAMGIDRSVGTNNSITAREGTTPSRPGDLVYELAERIQVLLRDGKGEIRIQLKPEHLGNLEIRAENGGNGVIARITAESGSVKNYLENNLHLLQQSLQDQGLKIDRIQVVVQDMADPQQTSGQSAQFGHAGSGNQNGETFKPTHSSKSGSVNPVEEISMDPIHLMSGSRSRFHTVA